MKRPISQRPLFVLALLTACGGTKEPANPPAPTAVEHPRESRSPKHEMQVSSELGSIDDRAVAHTFAQLQGEMKTCYTDGRKRVSFLSGDVKFFLRVTTSGSAKVALLEESTVGDRATETCMLDVLRRAKWPIPQGGEAEVRNTMGFDAPTNVRPAVAWNADKLASALGKAEKDIEKCKHGGSAVFHVTAYVYPAGKHGKVEAVGMTTPSAESDSSVECLIEVLKDLKGLPSPGSYPAKVSFTM